MRKRHVKQLLALGIMCSVVSTFVGETNGFSCAQVFAQENVLDSGGTESQEITEGNWSEEQGKEPSDSEEDSKYTYVLDGGNAADVQYALDHGGDKIRLKGEFKLSQVIWLPSRSNVTVDATGAYFYNNCAFLSGKSSGFTWIGGTFETDGEKRLGFTVLHMKKVTFKNMTFIKACPFGKHVFDFLGCDGITMDNITFMGYGNSMNYANKSEHDRYSEAIQLDTALFCSSGYDGLTDKKRSKEIKDRYLSNGDKFDGKATKNVKVTNCTFTSITDSSGKIVSWAQTPFGEHTYAKKDCMKNIRFTNNRIINPIPLKRIAEDRYNGAVHLVCTKNLVISDNVFEITDSSAKREVWIQVANDTNEANDFYKNQNLTANNITIKNNTFLGTAPTKAFISFDSTEFAAPHYTLKNIVVKNNQYVSKSGKTPKNFIRLLGLKSQYTFKSKANNKGITTDKYEK